MKKRFFIFKRINGKTCGRKGMGMELALLVLLAVFACSTLLVSSAVFGKSALMREEAEVFARLELDELAENALRRSGAYTAEYADYTVEKTASKIFVKDKSDKVLLEVTYMDGKITAWDYK